MENEKRAGGNPGVLLILTGIFLACTYGARVWSGMILDHGFSPAEPFSIPLLFGSFAAIVAFSIATAASLMVLVFGRAAHAYGDFVVLMREERLRKRELKRAR